MGDQVSQGGSPFEFYKDRAGRHDWYRCYKCKRLFTYEEERARLNAMPSQDEDKAKICKCGSLKYTPTRMSGFDWLRPNVVAYTLKLVLARGIAPWFERHFKSALPWIERLCRPMQ
jgi:hypothetical protein